MEADDDDVDAQSDDVDAQYDDVAPAGDTGTGKKKKLKETNSTAANGSNKIWSDLILDEKSMIVNTKSMIVNTKSMIVNTKIHDICNGDKNHRSPPEPLSDEEAMAKKKRSIGRTSTNDSINSTTAFAFDGEGSCVLHI